MPVALVLQMSPAVSQSQVMLRVNPCVFLYLWCVCTQTCPAHADCGRSGCLRHVEVRKVCCLGRKGLSLCPQIHCMECIVSVMLVCLFFLPILSVLNFRKRSKVVKTRFLRPPFLLMINVWLFSEEKGLGIRAFKMHYFQAVSIFRSCRHDNSMWWQSPNICPVRTDILEAAFICSWQR